MSDLAKMFGIGLFLFGLFTGFGGLLLTILATGIGSSAITYHKKFKKVQTFPKGSEKFEKEFKAVNKKNKINIKKRSTKEKEFEPINQLLEKQAISEDVANKIKETITNYSKTVGFVAKAEKAFASHLKQLENFSNKLNVKIAKLKSKSESTVEYDNKLKIVTDGIKALQVCKRDFEFVKRHTASDLENAMNALKDHTELSLELKNLTDQNVEARFENALNEHKRVGDLRRELMRRMRDEKHLPEEEFKRRDKIYEKQLADADHYANSLEVDLKRIKELKEQITLLENERLTTSIAKVQAASFVDDAQKTFNEFMATAKEIAEKVKEAKISNKVQKVASHLKNEQDFSF